MLIVGIVARISGGQNQKEISLDDQVDHAKEAVAEHYQGEVEYRVIKTTAKGERLDRPELAETEAMIRTRELDFLVLDDIGRLVRGTEAVRLCGLAVDHHTRVLAPNDFIDTDDDTWEEDLISACRDHVGHNAHTSRRLKHKLMNRFLKFGKAMAREISGYIVPDDATCYDDWQKDPTAEPIITEAAQRLRDTLNCSTVARWLNRIKFPVGPYCRKTEWDGGMVRRFFRNTTLKGLPSRGNKHTVKHNETGRRVPVKNPKGPKYRECPHLAFFEEAEFDGLNALLDEKNIGCGRKPVNGEDSRIRVPRKRTRFPGQWSQCWYCGHQHVWGGNGITANLMCNAARQWHCWNSIGFNGALATERIVSCITAELAKLPGLDDQFQELVQEASRDEGGLIAQRRENLRRNEISLAQERQNVTKVIAAYGPSPVVQTALDQLKAKETEIARERYALERLRKSVPKLPESLLELRGLLHDELTKLAIDSPEFGDLLRKLVPSFYVYLVRLCDGGHLLPRAKCTLALDGILPDSGLVPGLSNLLMRELTIELFDPPQRERIREQAVSLRAQNLGQKEIAARISEKPTITAVQRAFALDRKMKSLGLTTPYVVVLEPPEDLSKLRRHKNSAYSFTPRNGYERPAL